MHPKKSESEQITGIKKEQRVSRFLRPPADASDGPFSQPGYLELKLMNKPEAQSMQARVQHTCRARSRSVVVGSKQRIESLRRPLKPRRRCIESLEPVGSLPDRDLSSRSTEKRLARIDESSVESR